MNLPKNARLLAAIVAFSAAMSVTATALLWTASRTGAAPIGEEGAQQ